MKKLLKFILPIVIAAALGTTSIILFKDNTEYYVDTTYFQSTYAYKEDVDLSGLKIVEIEKEEIKAEHQVDESMVLSCDSTSSVGEKELVLKFGKEEFVVNFIVMYEIQFMSDDEVYDLQYVLKASEIKMPDEPRKSGYEFKGWSPEVPKVINDNMTFEAVYSDTPESIPNLGVYEATYGDTLESISLPSNQFGSWKFVDELTTTVGNVGVNTFEVEFIPTNSELKVIKDTVKISVSKKTLTFNNVVTTFNYDGEEHLPTYELEVEGLNVVTMGTPGIEVGTYFIMFVIQDDNYEGQWQGNFTIKSSEISISFDTTELSDQLDSTDAYYTIQLGENIPANFVYTVNGIDNVSLLQLSINVPKVNHAGTYEVTIQVGNTSYKNVKITNKCYLIVEKTSLGAGLPTLTAQAIYGNKLSSVTFEDNNPNGYWVWENPDYYFDYAGEHVVNLVFTPYSSLDYDVQVEEVNLNVLKRTLTFVNIESVYTYDGLEHIINYTLLDGENEITGINVVGQVAKTNAGSYETKLEVVEDNYAGSYDVSLKINKANPETNFDVTYEDIVIGTVLKDIEGMPEGYSWVLGSTILEKAGTFEYDVVFTPEDTDNYNVISGKFTVNVIKKNTSIEIVNKTYNFVYDGTVHKLIGIYPKRPYEESELKFYNIDINDPNNKNVAPAEVVLMNAGTYTVYITLLENDEYYTVVEAVTVVIDGSGVDTPIEYTATYGDYLNSIKLPTVYDENNELVGKWVWENEDPNTTVGNAGVQFFKAVFESVNPNYENEPVEVKVTVLQKAVTIKILESEYDYDGNEHTISYKVIDGENELQLNVTGNQTKVNQGKYAVTLTINEHNYSGTITTELVINSIDPEVSWPTLKADVFTTLFSLKKDLVQGMSFTCDDFVFEAVGEYTFDAEFVQPGDEYNNYNKLTGKVTIIVGSLDSTIAVDEEYKFAYGEKVVINAIPSHNESELVFEYYQNDESVNEIKNVGTYDVIITLPATENYNEAVVTTKVIIIKKEVKVEWLYEKSYVYTGSALEVPNAYIQNVDGAYVDLVVTEINANEFINAGKYQFTADFEADYEGTNNYILTEVNSVEVEIIKAVIDLSKYTWNYTGPYVYNGTNYTVELLNLHSALTPKYESNSNVNAGDYVATVTFTYDEANYEVIGEVAACEWSITTSAVAVKWEYENSYTFTGYELVMPKAYILDGTIELTVKVENETEFRNAGTYTFVASIEGGNYALSNTRLPNITVEKAELEVVWTYETEYVYTGEVLAKPTAKVIDLLGSEIELITLSNNGIFKNAGEYTFNAIFLETYADKDNYELTNTVSNTVEVLKADYDLSDISWDYSSTFTYDGLEHKVQLVNVESGLTAKYEGNAATNAGEYTATVTFDYDKANYNEPTFDSLDWTIESKVVEVEWTYENEYVYTGSTLAAPTATYENVNGEVLSLFVKEINGKEFKTAGEYTFVANIADPAIANNYSLTESYIIVSIESTSLSFDKQLTAIYGDTLADVELPTSEFGTWSFVDELTTSVGNAGKNTFTVKFDSNSDNYESEEKEVVITVSKKSVVISVVQNTFTYDGSNKTIDVKVLDGTTELNINVLGNETAKNAGTYSTTLSINEANYVASVVETSLVIEKAEAVITNSLEVNNSDYDGSEVDLTKYFALNHDETEIIIEITVARTIQAMKDAGVYTIVVTATETDNYLAAEPVIVIYTVNQIDANLVYTKPTDGYTYNGSFISVNSYVSHDNTDNNATITYKYQLLDGETYVDVDSIVEAGTYKVTASIASTINFKEDSITFEVVVEKGHFNVEELESINAIYGQQLNHFNFQNDSRGTWSWKNPNDYVGNVGENTHTAVLTPNDESMDIVEIEVKFIVSPKEIKFTLGQTTFDYDGNEHTVTYTLSETPEGVAVESAGTITATDYVAGGYAFGFEIAGNNNYTGSITGTLIINQISSGVVAPALNAVYNETYKDIILPENENGTWSFVAELSTSVGNAGAKTVVLKFTPNSSNYKTENINATLTVAKADYTPTAIPTTYDATYGDLLSTIKLPTTDEKGTWRWDSNGTVGNAGTNSFTATFTHENPNYNTYTTTVTVNVAKAESIITNNLPDTLTYSGSELIKKYFSLNHNEGSLVFTITGKGSSVVNAGTYTVVVSVAETANYNAESTDSIKVVVGQATPDTDFTRTFTYTYGKVLSNADLSVYNTTLGHYEWVNPVLLEVGANQTIAAKFVPNDAVNYKEVQGSFHVTIEKIGGTIEVNDSQSFTYGDAIDLGATTNNIDQGSKVVVTGLELNVDGFVNAGTYTVTLTVAESAHYTKATATITVTIEKKEEAIELPETFEYGTTASDIVPTASEYGEFVVYDTNPNGTSSVSVSYNSNSNATFVKTQTIWVEFIPAEKYAHNYAGFVKEIEITIVRKEITFENVVSSFVYDGNAHEVEYTLNGVVAGEANPTVTGNKSVTNVIEGEVSVTLNIDTAYYYGSTTVTLKITPATPTTDFTTVYEAYWNTNLSSITLSAGYTWDANETLSTVGDGQKFATTYNAKNNENYNPNYISVSGEFTVNVNKLSTELTITSDAFANPTYIAGTTYTITATAKNGGEASPIIKVNGFETYTIGNAGSYTVVVTVAETTHYEAAEKTIEFTIAQATPDTDFTIERNGVYGNVLSSVTLPNANNGTYSWTNPNTPLATGTQTYEATFTPKDTVNYKSVTSNFTVIVAKANATVTANATYTFTYTGNEVVLTGITASHSESAVTYEKLVNAGTYTITITLPESTNYNKATTTTTVVINKAKVALPTGLTANYGDTLSQVTLPTSSYGVWSYENVLSTSVGNAGTRKFAVHFESSNENYESFDDEVTITVARIDTVVTANIPTNLKYDETVFDHTAWFTVNHSETTMAYTISGPANIVQNAGTYTIVVTMNESTNYKAFSYTYTVTVEQAEYTVSSVATAANAIYGDKLSIVALSNGDTSGQWTWKEATTVIDGVGTKTYVAVFTPTNTNYKASEHDVNISVDRKQLTITVTQNEFVYDGQAHSLIYSIDGLVGNDTVEVIGNKSITNVVESQSSTNIVLTIDTLYYYGVSSEANLVITPAAPKLNLPTITGKYEDRVVDEDLVAGLQATNNSGQTVSGTYSYDKSAVVYPAGSTNDTETIQVVVTFVPEDAVNYKESQEYMSVTLLAVTYNENANYFGTVEKALINTESGVVSIIVGTHPIIKSNVTVPLNVTLLMPYAEGVANSSTASSNTADLSGTITNTLTINENIKLTVNGKLEIGGILSGGNGGSNFAGHTCDQYTVLYLENNAEIYSTGEILCYGYIEEKTYYNGSKVIVDEGNIAMPFILRDFKGGSQTYALYDAFDTNRCSPFNQYEFINVTPTLKINYNGSLIAWANLYAGDQHNATMIEMIGNSADSVIRFTDSTYSYFESKYDKKIVHGKDLAGGDITGKINVYIYGGATANKLKLTLNVMGSITISTEELFFPITYKYNITLLKAPGQIETAEFMMTQSYKLMPGSTLKVSEGTSLTSNSDLIVYTYFDDTAAIMAGNKYPVKETSGKLIVNGSLNVNKFGGLITTETESGAVISIKEVSSLTSYEPQTYSGSSILTKIEEWFPITEQFKLYLFEGTTISANPKTVAVGTYYSKNNGWYSTTASIYYNANGGTLTGNESDGPYETGANGYTITEINTTNPIRDYYNFEGWYFDEKLTIPAIGSTIFVNSYLYAKWSPITYDINYYNKYFEGETDTEVTNYGSFTYETNTALMVPTNGDYVFGGWYTDADCKNRIANIIGQDLVEKLNGNNVTLYALWYPSETKTYRINYETNLFVENQYDYREILSVYNDYSFVIVDENDWLNITLQQMTLLDTKVDCPYYFGGWYTTSMFDENTKVETISSSIFGQNTTITLYAKWIKKFEVTVKFDIISLIYYLKPTQYVTLPSIQQMGISFVEVEDKNTSIILRKLQFIADGVAYNPNSQFSVTKDVTVTGSIVETIFYQTTLQAENGVVNVNVNNGYIIKSSEDTILRTTYKYDHTGSLSSENIYISAGSTVSVTFEYKIAEYNGYAITYTTESASVTVQSDTYKSGGWWPSYKGTPANPNSFVLQPYIYSIGMSSGNKKNDGMCIYGNSLVLMSDGTTKLAKDVRLGDLVLTWSFAEGKYVAAPIMFVEKLQNILSHKTTLYFDDGTSVELANGQSFFDVNKREFVSINNNNVFDFIGITIMSYNNGEIGYKQIIDATVEVVIEDTYEFITAYEYSFIYDNVLTMEPFMLYKLPFEINEEFKYDEELMLKDIETYGLYTYEEWSNYVTEEQFELFNGWYIKVAVEKGYYSIDYLIEIIQRYVNPQNMGK